MRQKLARDLETLISSNYQALMKAREQFGALQTALALAQENLRVRRRAFEEGLSTSLEVVDAQLSLSAVKVERLGAVCDFDVALAGLLANSGRSMDFIEYLSKTETDVGKLITKSQFIEPLAGIVVLLALVGGLTWFLQESDIEFIQGEVDATQVDLAVKIAGRVAKVWVKEGQSVGKGALLLDLDMPEIRARLRTGLSCPTSRRRPTRQSLCRGSQ